MIHDLRISLDTGGKLPLLLSVSLGASAVPKYRSGATEITGGGQLRRECGDGRIMTLKALGRGASAGREGSKTQE